MLGSRRGGSTAGLDFDLFMICDSCFGSTNGVGLDVGVRNNFFIQCISVSRLPRGIGRFGSVCHHFHYSIY